MTFHNAGEIAQVSVIERWQWYFGALRDPTKIGSAELPIHANEYQLGYYRTRSKGGQWEPVGIYPDEKGLVVGFRSAREVDDVQELFLWACRYPISYEAYIEALEGKPFADEDETVSAQVAKAGHNSAAIDEAEEIKDQIESALAGMKAYEKVDDDATAAKALSLRNRLNELSNKADKVRTEQKAPHLAAGKAVDEKWQPLVKK
ncbi:hypothetical protein ACR8HR_22605, partial [Salmonella enterica subsp. enterica serovar Paratyphi A]